MDSLIVIGFDGFAKAIIDSAMGVNHFESIIILNYEKIGLLFADSKIADTTDKLQDYFDQGYHSTCIIVDPSTNTSPDVTIDDGTYIGEGCAVGPCATVGKNSILDTGVIMQSRCSVGNLSRVCTGGENSYNAQMGDLCYVGVGSIVTENSQIPDNTRVEDASVYGKQPFEQ